MSLSGSNVLTEVMRREHAPQVVMRRAWPLASGLPACLPAYLSVCLGWDDCALRPAKG